MPTYPLEEQIRVRIAAQIMAELYIHAYENKWSYQIRLKPNNVIYTHMYFIFSKKIFFILAWYAHYANLNNVPTQQPEEQNCGAIACATPAWLGAMKDSPYHSQEWINA